MLTVDDFYIKSDFETKKITNKTDLHSFIAFRINFYEISDVSFVNLIFIYKNKPSISNFLQKIN